MKKNITISDVAEQVSVSKATISRYLNGNYGKMSKETKKRIEEVIAELDYRPNKQAQALKSKKSYLIGVIVADISNMYSSLLLKGIGEVLGEAGYQMIIMDAANSIEQEQDLLNKLLDQQVEGIILQASSWNGAKYQFLQKTGIPVLLVDREIEPLLFPLVTADNSDSTKQLSQLILEKNYDCVTVISEPLSDIITREVRYQSVREVILAAEKEVKLIELTKKMSLRDELKKIAASPQKEAIFASNGRVLMDCLTILIEEEIKIPEDIGVVGFDDWQMSALVGPGITSIEQQTKIIGEKSAKRILSLLENNEVKIEIDIIKSKITNRGSL